MEHLDFRSSQGMVSAQDRPVNGRVYGDLDDFIHAYLRRLGGAGGTLKKAGK